MLLDQEWNRRHRWIVWLLWVHAAGLFCFALLLGYGLAHSLFEGSLVGITALLAGRETFGRKLRSGVASFGLVTSSAVLVHLWDGQIEGHFHFFFVVILLTLYQDWFPFLLAIAYVVAHHAVLGTVDPASVYNHAPRSVIPGRGRSSTVPSSWRRAARASSPGGSTSGCCTSRSPACPAGPCSCSV